MTQIHLEMSRATILNIFGGQERSTHLRAPLIRISFKVHLGAVASLARSPGIRIENKKWSQKSHCISHTLKFVSCLTHSGPFLITVKNLYVAHPIRLLYVPQKIISSCFSIYFRKSKLLVLSSPWVLEKTPKFLKYSRKLFYKIVDNRFFWFEFFRL